MNPIADAENAASYFGKSDGGYYLGADDLHRVWGGKGAELLGLRGPPELEQFKRLIQGLDPHTGKQLTAMLIEERIPGWDMSASLPKGVTTAIERGDSRIVPKLWEAAHETMADIEKMATTRVRKGGTDADRVTGNLVWFAVEHYEGRPTKEDGMPDWDRHLHFVVFNVTWDEVEAQWKAVKIRPVFDIKKYFSHSFDLRMSGKLAELGYELETKLQPDDRGGRKYHTWDIKAAPGHEAGWNSINAKNSRRSEEIGETEEKIVAGLKARDANAPDRLSAVARDKLGASSRRAKRKDLKLADYRDYWNARITPEEARAIEETIMRAREGRNPKPEPLAAKAMAYAIAHQFQRNSVVDFHDLAVTAMEKCMGAALPEEFEVEARRQGVLFKGNDVSTAAVLAQEQRIIAFARAGRGSFSPLHPGKTAGLDGLSAEQKAAVTHIWQSSDQILLIRGGAGTGKTTMMKPALDRLGVPVALLAPSADASRKTLRESGFEAANTVAAFLGDKAGQERLRGGGIIYVDEAGMLSIDDLERLCHLAGSLDARIVLQGDPKQHESVDRNGNMLKVLEAYAGLPLARLTKIQRQKGEYAAVVAAIRDAEFIQGDAMLRKLGWVVEGEGHAALVAEYAKAIEETKPNGERKTVLVIDPTHKDGDKLSEALRTLRKGKGLVSGEERPFTRLVPLNFTNAQKGEASQYDGSETIQFFRHSGRFKAGERVKASELLPHLGSVKPEHFAAYREEAVSFAVGDTVRITNNGRDVTGKHRIDNAHIDTIKAFTRSGDIVLSNGWVMAKDFAHFKHGLVQTSPATQSKTEDIILSSLNAASCGAMSARQAYVTISRGRERGMLFTDMKQEALIEAISRDDRRLSATELFHEPPPAAKPVPVATARDKMRALVERVQQTYRQLRMRAHSVMVQPIRERQVAHDRER